MVGWLVALITKKKVLLHIGERKVWGGGGGNIR